MITYYMLIVVANPVEREQIRAINERVARSVSRARRSLALFRVRRSLSLQRAPAALALALSLAPSIQHALISCTR